MLVTKRRAAHTKQSRSFFLLLFLLCSFPIGTSSKCRKGNARALLAGYILARGHAANDKNEARCPSQGESTKQPTALQVRQTRSRPNPRGQEKTESDQTANKQGGRRRGNPQPQRQPLRQTQRGTQRQGEERTDDPTLQRPAGKGARKC